MIDHENKVKERVYERMDLSCEIEDDDLIRIIDDEIVKEKKTCLLSVRDRERLMTQVFNSIRKFDVLQELLEDDDITEIMINGSFDIYIERYGKIERCDRHFENDERLADIAQRIAALSNRIVNATVPIVDTRLADGSRVNIVLPPIAIDGPTITIRKFYKNPLTIEKMIEKGSLNWELANFLRDMVRARYNIFVCGGTGSGKTTFLNAMSDFIPGDERIITIEDSAELQIRNIGNLVRLEARNANVEGKNAVTIRDLIKTSLRMRPDRIIVGEVRGEEAFDMLQAMSTGHDGSMCTGHGNSPMDMMSRLEMMILMGQDMPLSAIKKQLASSIDILIFLSRLRDRSRRVLKVVEINGIKEGEINLNTLYEFKERGEEDGRLVGEIIKVNDLVNKDKLHARGIG